MSEATESPNPEATARHLLTDAMDAPIPEVLGTPLAVEALPTLAAAPEQASPRLASAPMGPTVLVLGASSPLGRAFARAFAEVGYDLVVSARSPSQAQAVAADLRLRHGVGAMAMTLDPLAFHQHAHELNELMEALGDRLVGAVVAWGHHADPTRAEQEGAVLRRVLALNLVAPASALEPLAAHLAKRGTGFLAAVCPFEGLQGSAKARAFGAAKAGLAAYLKALRVRMAPLGVHVATLWMPTLDHRATHARDAKSMPSPLHVARAAVHAIRRGEDEAVLPRSAKAMALLRRYLPASLVFRWWE